MLWIYYKTTFLKKKHIFYQYKFLNFFTRQQHIFLISYSTAIYIIFDNLYIRYLKIEFQTNSLLTIQIFKVVMSDEVDQHFAGYSSTYSIMQSFNIY